FNAMPVVAGGFSVWRRDILYDLGGYSAEFTCEDIELTFRVQDYAFRNKDKGYLIKMMPYYVGWTEGPGNTGSLISQRERWQRVTDETIWRYKYMICNPRYGIFAFLTLPYFVLYEVLGVFFELASLAFVVIGWLAGILDIKTFLVFMALMILSQCFISLLSILIFLRNQRIFRVGYIAYLTFLSFIEMFWYRWLLSAAKIVGTYRFLRGKKTFDQYKRGERNTS
ncbi:MAG: glycosyltransferase family 2 protein, partial [Candidatus Omnitrophica bacterium]|nr:glycosyltransferase family 2 protein [Candidatus Omnitrophota bacterium]